MADRSFRYDFFLSRRGTVAAVAQEVAGVLEAEHYKVRVQDYDAVNGGNFPLFIHDALTEAQHLIVLHSADYDATHWTRQEFGHFLAAPDAREAERRICVLRCDDADPRGLLAGVVYGDLHNVTDPAERRRIILAVARGEAPASRTPPRIFGGATMPLENLLFTGRDDELAALHRALASETTPVVVTQAVAAAPGLPRAAVHGLGGVGKTSLARAYIAKFAPEYGGVWWITATDPSAIRTGLGDLARALDPALPADITAEAAAAKALAMLAARPGPPFLLVYDNVPGPETLDGLLPPRGAAELLTSRASDWGGMAQEVAVDALSEDAAVEFLLRRADRTDAEGARRLAAALGRLPLALDHAGALVKRAGISFDAYAQRVAERIQAEPPRGVAYPRSVSATFALAIEDAAREAPAASTLLGLFAWYAPEAIPLALADASVLSDAEREAAVAALRGVSLLTPAPEGACGPAVSVHRLVQTVMRTRLAAVGQADVARDAAVAGLHGLFPNNAYRDPGPWPRCRILMPHLRSLHTHTGDVATAPLAGLFSRADNFLDGSGATAEAAIFARRALEIREQVLGPDHPDTLGSVNNLAGCLRASGDAAGALPLHRRALENCERVLGPDHPNTLTSVNNLAGCLRALGDAAGALPLYRRALKACERVLGPDHPDTLISVNNLALCLEELGDAAGALPLHRRALKACERVLGPDHPYTLSSVNNLAGCLRALGDAAGALPLLRRAAEGFAQRLGPDHPSSRTVRANLDQLEQELATQPVATGDGAAPTVPPAAS